MLFLYAVFALGAYTNLNRINFRHRWTLLTGFLLNLLQLLKSSLQPSSMALESNDLLTNSSLSWSLWTFPYNYSPSSSCLQPPWVCQHQPQHPRFSHCTLSLPKVMMTGTMGIWLWWLLCHLPLGTSMISHSPDQTTATTLVKISTSAVILIY